MDSSWDKYILWGTSSEIQKDFPAPDFYLNCFFLCFFLLFNKRILLLILLTQKRQFRVLFFIVEELYLSNTLYLMGKASHLLEFTSNNFNYNSPSGFKMWFRSSWWYLWHKIAFGRPQPTSVPCVNWWTWWERTAPSKPAGHMAV